MPSRNVENLLEGFRAMERGDVEWIVALAAPDVEFVNPDHALESGTRHGPDGLRIGMHGILDAFEDLRFTHDRTEEVGDRVVATGTFSARGRGSGIAFGPMTFAVVATQRDGKLTRYEWFAHPDDALRAVGLSSES
jgi:ketosteroid isomerase-like protein